MKIKLSPSFNIINKIEGHSQEFRTLLKKMKDERSTEKVEETFTLSWVWKKGLILELNIKE